MPKLDAFLFFDYSQIEMRFLAFYMANVGDESMCDVYRKEADPDLHAESAKAIYKKDVLSDEERQTGKTFNFATVYGQGVKKCAATIGVTFEEAGAMLDVFHARWPGIKLLHNLRRGEAPGAIQRELERKGYITTLHGRHLHPHLPHKALNTLIQGAAADLMRASLINIHHWIKKEKLESHLVNAVHDEAILDVTKDEIPVLVEKIPSLMQNKTLTNVLPIGIDCEISFSTWADKENIVEYI